jgi:hypothetical protein
MAADNLARFSLFSQCRMRSQAPCNENPGNRASERAIPYFFFTFSVVFFVHQMLCTDYQLHDKPNIHKDLDLASVDLSQNNSPCTAADIENYGLSEYAILPSSLTGT